jgi:hypothetical protein
MLVNYYYVCIRKLWKSLRNTYWNQDDEKNSQKFSVYRFQLAIADPIRLRAPLQTLLPNRLMQRFFMLEDRA